MLRAVGYACGPTARACPLTLLYFTWLDSRGIEDVSFLTACHCSRVTGDSDIIVDWGRVADDSGAIDKHCAVYVPPQLEMERAFRR